MPRLTGRVEGDQSSTRVGSNPTNFIPTTPLYQPPRHAGGGNEQPVRSGLFIFGGDESVETVRLRSRGRCLFWTVLWPVRREMESSHHPLGWWLPRISRAYPRDDAFPFLRRGVGVENVGRQWSCPRHPAQLVSDQTVGSAADLGGSDTSQPHNCYPGLPTCPAVGRFLPRKARTRRTCTLERGSAIMTWDRIRQHPSETPHRFWGSFLVRDYGDARCPT